MSEAKKKELQEASISDKVTNYLRGVRAEWDKITWPEKKQVAVETVIVLGIVVFFTILVYVLDIIFNFMFKLIPGG